MKARRVNFFDNDSDFQCAVLASMGFSTNCIIRHTKLRPGQISYRLKLAAIRRMDYRDGTSESAHTVLRGMRPVLNKQVAHHLEKRFK